MFMGYEVSRLDLTQGDSQSPVSAFKIQPYNPAANSITCADGRTIAMPSTKDQSLDSVTMFLDKNGKFLLGMRSSIEFDSSANVVRNSVLAGKGLSTLVSVAYDSAANTNTKTTIIPYTNCVMLRKFEKGTSGYFAYLTEPFDVAVTDGTFKQTTTVLDDSFTQVLQHPKGTAGQYFKLGGMLNPMNPQTSQ
jgi:hypothetical protein